MVTMSRFFPIPLRGGVARSDGVVIPKAEGSPKGKITNMLLIFDLDGTLFKAKPVVQRVGLDTTVPDYFELLDAAIREHGKLFSGVSNMLKQLHSAGHNLIICSKSPMEYIRLVLIYTEISEFFTRYYSSESYASKAVLVSEIITPKTPAAVIGDTHGDISAAKKNGLPSIAAMYGYGNKAMLENADYFADSPEEIITCVEKLLLSP